ncbi:MAG: sigma-70 family RNA polymerase sigma factor [Planctomycetota bacterium]|nr:sigma-70 family RNA polymerase sigma factor [Planctomycetota bacterium]
MDSHPQPRAPADLPPGTAPSHTDVQVARWQAGDETAFGLLYQRFAPLLALRIRRHRAWPGMQAKLQIEDVVQESWMRVVPGASRTFTPGGEGSFLAFLSKVTDNTLIDLARRASAVKRGDGQAVAALELVAGDDVLARPGILSLESPTSAARRSELQVLAERTLTEREHAAWELVELQGYNAEEAGLAMGSTGSSVRGLLLRSRAKLVLALGEESGA